MHPGYTSFWGVLNENGDMKLELKHLASYLPYSLKWMFGKTKYNTAWMSTKNVAVINTQGYGEVEKFRYANIPKDLKPILRPLSDLTKEIEHNGESVCLFDKYQDLGRDLTDILDDERWVWEYPYHIVSDLLAYHFDVFGLIEKGLAIDINTLEK